MQDKSLPTSQTQFRCHPLDPKGGNIVFVAGQTGSIVSDTDGPGSYEDGIVQQTRMAWQKILNILESVGLNCENIVRTVDYVRADALAGYRETAEVRREYLKDSPVAATGICVEEFIENNALIKITAIAVEGEKETIVPEGPEFTRFKNFTYVPAVRTGALTWLSGATGFQRDTSGRKVYAPDFDTQVDLTYSFLEKVLASAGLSAADVVSRVEYLSPQALGKYAPGAELRRPPHQELRAPLTVVGMTRLLSTQRQIEVELTAATGHDREQIHLPGRKLLYESKNQVLGIRAGSLIFFSCQSSSNPIRQELFETGVGLAAQARNSYRNLSEVCAATGIGMDTILHTTEFIVPQTDHRYQQLDAVRRDFFGDELPAITTVLTHQHMDPTLLFGVVAVAGV